MAQMQALPALGCFRNWVPPLPHGTPPPQLVMGRGTGERGSRAPSTDCTPALALPVRAKRYPSGNWRDMSGKCCASAS
jgi:hypothetical protein